MNEVQSLIPSCVLLRKKVWVNPKFDLARHITTCATSSFRDVHVLHVVT